MGVSAFCHYAVNVGITEAGPSAFATIHENYYYVFVGCCSVYWFIIYFFYPETNQKTLEEIAAAFGDKVVDLEISHKDGSTLPASLVAKPQPTTIHLEDDGSV